MYQGIQDVDYNGYYKSGDVIDTQDDYDETLNPLNFILVGGAISGSQKDVMFSIPVGKSLKNITTARITKLIGAVRTVDGKYLNNSSNTGYDWVVKSNITVRCYVLKSTNMLYIGINTAGSFSNVPANNTPVSILISRMVVELS